MQRQETVVVVIAVGEAALLLTADRKLVNAAIAMAHGLNVEAEAVETHERRAHLTQQVCNYAQCYLFSRPVSTEEISAMLEDPLSLTAN